MCSPPPVRRDLLQAFRWITLSRKQMSFTTPVLPSIRRQKRSSAWLKSKDWMHMRIPSGSAFNIVTARIADSFRNRNKKGRETWTPEWYLLIKVGDEQERHWTDWRKIVYYIPICYFLVRNSKYNVHQNITFQYLSGFRYWSFPCVWSLSVFTGMCLSMCTISD